jgi:hypothetical protein
MDGSGSRLTELLLDLTEDSELRGDFNSKPDPIIERYGLQQHADLIKRRDVKELREAVRTELGLPPRPAPGVRFPDSVIAGLKGVRAAPDADQPMTGVREPSPNEPIEGVREPPPDEA